MEYLRLIHIVCCAALVSAQCYEPSPAFPVPQWQKGGPTLEKSVFEAIGNKLDAVLSKECYDTSSLSFEVTSSSETIWSYFHTAREKDGERPGAEKVDEQSLYRIASITKTFTTLAMLYQHAAGNLSIEDPVSDYISELAGKDSGKIPWKDITLRKMASQMSGLPREFAQADLLTEIEDPTMVGLPPASRDVLPPCYHDGQTLPCNRTELLNYLKTKEPLFAPNQQSTYSNVNFELLGLVIENVTGTDFSSYIEKAIFEPLEMRSSHLSKKPSDKHAVLPKGRNEWDVEKGVLKPSGGIYSSTADLSKFVRYILTHYNALVTGLNWLLPESWSGGVENFYGMPFEIFRTDRILEDSRRAVTFVTKGGSHPGYYSTMALLPEYGLGFTILVAGNSALKREVFEVVGTSLVRAAEKAIWISIDKVYAGAFVATNRALNSSLELESSPATGLIINSFISNGTDVPRALAEAGALPDTNGKSWRAQLVPTLLFKDEEHQEGEIWRMMAIPKREKGTEGGIFEAFCNIDIDEAAYGTKPLNEIVFWHEQGLIEMPAWNLTLKAAVDVVGEGFFHQGL